MYNNKKNFEVNEEQTAAFLANAVENVRSDLDVDSLAALAKLYKKNVPFSLRKYVTAYLLREALKHDHSFRQNFRTDKNGKNRGKRNDVLNENDNRNSKRDNRLDSKNDSKFENKNETKTEKVEAGVAAHQTEERQPRPRVEIPEDQAATIFISIGRNRRVFPRDLVSLLINAGNLDRERIGNIKILANYSFVQLYAEDAEKTIAALNDFEYRGRKLSVNFSRPKAEGDGAENYAAENSVETANDSMDVNAVPNSIEDQMSAEDAAAYAAAEKAAKNEPFGN